MILSVCPNPSVDTYVYLHSFAEGEVNRVQREVQYPGGKGTHVALGINELGERVSLLGFWAGATGRWVKHELEKKGIECYGPEVDGWTRSCLTFKTDDSFDESELLGVGPEIKEDDLAEFIVAYEQLLSQSSMVVMSGSWPKGAPDDAYAMLAKSANEKDIPLVLDATDKLLQNAILEKPTVIHLNKNEAARFTGIQNIRGMLIHLYNKVEVAAVTDGKKGLYFTRNNSSLHGSLILPTVHSAVGSGDSLTAGLVVALKRGYNDTETVKLAVACGAANCLREDLGMFYKKDVEQLLEDVRVDEFEIVVS